MPPVSPSGSYMEQVQALQDAQAKGKSQPKTDPAVAAAVAAAASGSPSKIGGAAVSEAMAAKARAAAEAQVAAATEKAKAAADARLAAAANRSNGGAIDVGDEVSTKPGVPDGGGEDEEDAALAAAIAASLQTSDGPTDEPAAPQYVAEKEQLAAMGFADDSANMLALQSTNGDVQRALELLLA